MEQISIPPRWGTLVAELAQKQGWDAAEMLMGVQVSPRFLAGEPTTATPAQLRTVIREVLARTDDLSFGISSAPIPPVTLQILMFSLATSETPGAAFARWDAFRDAVPLVPNTTMVRSGELATVALDVSALNLPDATVTEWIMAIVVQMWTWLTMRSIQVERVLLPHAHPAGRSQQSKILGAPVEFDSGSAALILDAKLLDMPILRTEEEIISLLDHPEQLWFNVSSYRQQLPDRVERIVKTGIGRGIPTVGDIAAALNMTQSALQRSLRGEFGTSVREIRDEVLRDEAFKSLESDTESLTDLSGRLGFSELSAFTRAFRRWTDASPAQYRNRARSVK
ncbi:AraC family transcriptional regulator [Mycobacterium sp. CBMA271]|uniref:AraC family transcriptional regulator n=1 Tax=unclassified Mycobacteroides TaxID=2618759 RepID=UPI001329EC48|nr:MULTISPECIES: AraC family transcriptional regulator [unclassified Mycobacteroides]MUM15799.1 AraC family transcriptional regulator [Mycobacteroides sp. CBMA 326]MUM24408.1 AraC family transcriptional regulator [Mycobacteroides sp. CBMA 271]